MKVFLTIALLLLGWTLALRVPTASQEQITQTSPTQDTRLRAILGKLGEKAQEHRDHHTSLLRAWRAKSQYFKADLTTPEGKPEEHTGETLVFRRPLPADPSESGLFSVVKYKEVGAKKKAPYLKEATAHPFVSHLDFLLPEEQAGYEFSYSGQEKVQGRQAHVVSFVPIEREASKFYKQNGRWRFSSAARRGRALVDAESYDILRIDWTLIDNDQLRLHWGFERKGILFMTRPGVELKWERWDTTLKFKRYGFPNMERALWLPETMETVWLVRGRRKPAYKSSVANDYKRFQADVKVLDDVRIADDSEEEGAVP